MKALLMYAAIAAAAALALWWLVIAAPAQSRREAVQARAAATIANGGTKAATDTVGVVVGQSERDAATDNQTRTNDADIRTAPGAAAPVDPGVDAAGRRALCLRRAYSGSAACKQLLDAHP